MKIERGKNRRFDRLIDFERPNSLGIKWRFFLFAITLKNAAVRNKTFIFIMQIIDLIITISPSFYPMLYASSIVNNTFPQEDAIFPNSEILSVITPQVISTTLWIVLVLVFCIVSLISFIVCLYEPAYTLYIHLLLNIRIHMVLLPWTTGTLGYSIYCAVYSNQFTMSINGLPMVIIVIFPFYLYMISLLYFAEANSIIRPNSVSAEWFTHFPYWYPLEITFISLVGFQCVNLPKPFMYASLVVGALIAIASVANTILTMPMILFASNEVFASKMLVVASFLIVSIVTLFYDVTFSNILLAIVPVYIALVFMLVHFIFEKKRSSIQQLLSQIDTDIEQLTVDSLQTTLSPLTNQVSLITLVKEGLLSGNKAVISDVFVQYCLECYPRSEWFLGYVAFLYGIIWNSHPNVYRFLLHLLSLDAFSSPTEFVLFQYVYCYMQTSQSQSPMIVRRISNFRQTVLKFVSAHRKFWAAATDHDLNSFQDYGSQMYNNFLSLQHQAHILKLMFPFCPAVRCELCLFEADFMHNIIKADREYRIAASLLNPDDEHITATLFGGFSMFFPGARRVANNNNININNINNNNININNINNINNIADDTESVEYKFLSFQEHYDDAHRQGVSLNVNDTYLTSLTHTFTMSRNQPQIDPKVDSIRIFFAYFIIVVSIIMYFLVFLSNHYINSELMKSQDEIHDLNGVLDSTTNFRRNVNAMQFDIILLTNLANKTFSQFDAGYNLFRFVLEHLAIVESQMLSYKYLLDNLDPLNTNASLIETCSGVNCTFSYLFGAIHEKCLFFLHSGTANETVNFDPVNGLDLIVDDLSDIIDNIYDIIFKLVDSKANTTSHNMTWILSVIIGCELFVMLLVSISGSLIINRIKRNIADIIRTAQPPIIQHIACQFDKLLSFDQYQQPELARISNTNAFVPLIIMFLVLAIHPAIVLATIPRVKDYEYSRNALPPLLADSDTSQFLYFSLAKLEYSMIITEDIPVSNYETAIAQVHSCMHSMFDIECEKCSVYIQLNFDISNLNMKSIHGVLLAISVLFFIAFLRLSYLEIKVCKTGRLLLKFIPSTAAQSNPVFAKLLRGQSISSNDVYEFTDNIKTTSEDLSFFCVLYYDAFSERITHTIGDVERYLTFQPANIPELAKYIVEKSPEAQDEIAAFFENKTENESMNVSFAPGHEISLIFSRNPDTIVVKDDSHHYEANSRIRMTKRLNKALDCAIPTNLKLIQKVVLTVLTSKKKDVLKKLKAILGENQRFMIIDTRYSVICFLINADDPAIACQTALSFVEEDLKQFVPNIKLAMTYGGPLSFFDSMKNQTTKSRCVGVCYDCAKMMLNICELGKPMISKEVYELSGSDMSGMQFVDKKIASDVSIFVRFI